MAHYPTIPTNTTPTSDECQSIPGDVDSYYETMETLYSYPNDSQHSELNTLMTEEQTHWPTICSSPKDRPKSPYNNSPSPYHNFPPVYYQQNGHVYDEAYYGQLTNDYANNINRRVPVKRRNSANKKERKRTQSINSAFSSLREKIPCVPCDTKVSKIKTLRLAISYISFLQNKLNGHEDPSTEFKPELVSSSRKINAEKRNYAKACGKIIITTNDSSLDARRNKGRTGWPQHVWAGTLNNNNKLI